MQQWTTTPANHSQYLNQSNTLFQEYRKTHLNLFGLEFVSKHIPPGLSILCCRFYCCTWFTHPKGNESTFITSCVIFFWGRNYQKQISVQLIVRERIPHSYPKKHGEKRNVLHKMKWGLALLFLFVEPCFNVVSGCT